MLYPILSDTRSLIDLGGVWKFYLDDGSKAVALDQPLDTTDLMAVPGSLNDQGVLSKIRNHEEPFGMNANFPSQRRY